MPVPRQMAAAAPLSSRAAGSHRDRTTPWRTPILGHTAREICYPLRGRRHKVKESKMTPALGTNLAVHWHCQSGGVAAAGPGHHGMAVSCLPGTRGTDSLGPRLAEPWAGLAHGERGWLLPFFVTLPVAAAHPHRDRTRPWRAPVLSHTARDSQPSTRTLTLS